MAYAIALRGDLEAALQLLHDELGTNYLQLPLGRQLAFFAHFNSGRLREAQSLLASRIASNVALNDARDLWMQALIEQEIGRGASLDALVQRAQDTTAQAQQTPGWGHATVQALSLAAFSAELADSIEDETWLASQLALLRSAPWLRIATGLVLVDHARGLFALRLGLVDEASEWFRRGLDLGEEQDLPIGRGRCDQGLAEVAESRGDLEGAREHLDAAGMLFAKYGARLYLDQVLAKKQRLNA